MRATTLVCILATAALCAAQPAGFVPLDFTDIIAYAERQQDKWAAAIKYNVPAAWPQITGEDGLWASGDFNNNESWGSNYGPGNAWLLYKLTGKQKWLDEGTRLQQYFLSNQYRNNSHDIGMIMMSIYGKNYNFTGNKDMEQILINGATGLVTRFNPFVGVMKSWNTRAGTYQVIADNMMNLELLLLVSDLTGNKTFHEIALAHARNTATLFLRPDNGAYHVLDMSEVTGRPLVRGTQQGYSSFSTWSRGHAWFVYGYAYMYDLTRLEEFKEIFDRVFDFWQKNQLPGPDGSYVATWDFTDPAPLNVKPRDTSASAPMLVGLLRFASTQANPLDTIYFEKAHNLMKELSSPPYLNINDPTFEAILQQGSRDVPANKQNSGISWGDHYYMEAVILYRDLMSKYLTK